MDEFNKWNDLKKNIEKNTDPRKFPNEGEVWITNLGKNIGFEQDGIGNEFSRPVLVTHKFNNQMFWCIPLSSRQKNINFYFNYIDPHGQGVSAILAQMRLMSIKRFKRKLYDMEGKQMENIRVELKNFL